MVNPTQNTTIYVEIFGNIPARKVYWFKNNLEKDRFPFGVRQEDNNLVIINAHPETAGTYTCRILTDFGEIDKVVYVSYPQVAGYAPIITAPTERRLYAKLDEPFKFECIAEGSPAPSITIESPRDRSARPVELVLDASKSAAQVYLPRFGMENSGKYVCIASNSFGSTNQEFYVDVARDPPTIKISQNLVNVVEGSSLIINSSYTVSKGHEHFYLDFFYKHFLLLECLNVHSK
jgi:hypothetical protein